MTPGNDQLFRHALSIPEVVRQFLSAWLPAEFISLVDWGSLKIEKVSGINESLTERREDLVYSVNVAGAPVCFYILLEHQSAPDRFMPLRVVEYITLIWQNHRRSHGKTLHPQGTSNLPLVIPVVLYPGPGKWTTAKRLRDLIEIPESIASWASQFAPDAGFCTVELAGLPLEKLADGATARAVMTALQQERSGLVRFEQVQEIIAEIFSDPQREVAKQVATHLWHYLLHHSELQSQQIQTIISEVVPTPIQTQFMSTADLLKQEGEILAKQQDILEVLEIRFVSIPSGLRDVILEITDVAKLRELHRAAIQAADVETFSRSL
jgi:hypothetical protein